MRNRGDANCTSPVAHAVSDDVISPERLRLFAVLLGTPEGESSDLLNELRAEHGWLDRACEDLAHIPLEHWQAEHTRLFVTGDPKTACPPFKSAYSGQAVAGGAVEDLAGFYRDLGLSAKDMPPDYLGTALECWAYLISQAKQDEVQTLWTAHLEPWLSQFADDLQREADLELYRALGAQFGVLCRSAAEIYGRSV